jgi:hypothetical protein
VSVRRRRIRLAVLVFAMFTSLLAVAAGLMGIGRPSSPVGQRPIDGEQATASQEGLGPSNEGRPARQDHDEAGAIDAAIAYAVAPQAWLYLDDEEIRTSVGQISTPDAAARLTDEVLGEIGEARDRLARAAGPVWWIVHPLATKVQSYSPTEATISVWTVSLLSAADVAMPQTEWATSTFRLEWSAGGWRVAAVTDTVGPTPTIGPTDQPWEPESLDEALEGFQRLTWRADR